MKYLDQLKKKIRNISDDLFRACVEGKGKEIQKLNKKLTTLKNEKGE